MDSKNFIAQVEFAMRRRLKTPCGRRLTGNHVLVARRLAFSQARTPSHRLLAFRTGLSTKTVQRAFEDSARPRPAHLDPPGGLHRGCAPSDLERLHPSFL